MDSSQNDKTFKLTTALIQIIAILIGLFVFIASRYAFIFFAAAMLPTIFIIFFDRNKHKCLSATICTFNLIGVMPFLIRIWQSNSIDYVSKQILADIATWAIVYGVAFIGQLLYVSMPLLFVKMYSSKIESEIKKLQKQYDDLCIEWGI